ncbi:hypothetical protein TNCV_1204901 [Trichonephila clavipes]|nr:hypothetical protein TNCV_1204901 [Trichonephila clavipes]
MEIMDEYWIANIKNLRSTSLGGYTKPFERQCGNFVQVQCVFTNSAQFKVRRFLFMENITKHGKCCCCFGFIETITYHHYLMSEWIVDKRRNETCTSCCPMCLHKRPSCAIDAYTVWCQYRSDFIIHLHNFNYSSCRCTGTVSDLLGHIHSFTFPALHDSPI